MVNLENPYPEPRPPLSMFLPLPVIAVLGYMSMTCSFFTQIYQHSLAVILGVVTAALFDQELLTGGRIFKSSFPYRKIGAVAVSAGALFLVLFLASKFIFKTSVVYNFYRSVSSVSGVELLLVLAFVVAPFEELLFRGYLQLNLGRLAGYAPGFIAASILNGAFFIFSGSWLPVLYFLLIGLYCGYLYYKYSSVLLTSFVRALLMVLCVMIPF
jgi:membrane protease YdiL (CAAX protease family)